MDLKQRKLNKAEWESIEVPVSKAEQDVLKLITAGYNNVNIRINNNISLFQFLKMEQNEKMEDFLYNKYFGATVSQIEKSIKKQFPVYKPTKVDTNVQIKSADKIRLERNSDIAGHDIYENVLLKHIDLVVSGKNRDLNSFTLYKLMKNTISCLNRHIVQLAEQVLTLYPADINSIVCNSVDTLERNESLLKYGDQVLYDHQKEIFTVCKQPNPKLILYMAPTGTGKTLTPIGLAEKHRIIFVCAARHVGVALAKAAISAGRKVAFAFGCASAEDIRLHYAAAKEYLVNRKTGGIGKVDNSVGTEVEIMICDIKSYLPAMFYMKSFNADENLITYWDEPTITMDYDNHEFHEIISKNWAENLIPNMVLSSATLPKMNDISDAIADFKSKFSSNGLSRASEVEIYNIVSHDCKKSIPILSKDGFTVLPHFINKEYSALLATVAHCENYLTILRYFDLASVTEFIRYAHKFAPKKSDLLERHFDTLDDVDMKNVKMYYLALLKTFDAESWTVVYEHFQATRVKQMCDVYVTTKDSHTLTDGPTMFITDEIEKIAKFCIQQAAIPAATMAELMKKIEHNNVLNEKIVERENELEFIKEQAEKAVTNEANTARNKSTKDFRKLNRESNDGETKGDIAKLTKEVNALREMIKPATLNDTFVPNKLHHLKKWSPTTYSANASLTRAFTSDIDDSVVNTIMLLNGIDDTWKILLMMGIGVFINHENIAYTEVMKKLADEQKLYMIIASSDYIYGTNYQFCHCYLSKDLKLTQEKLIQAMGRVGRNNIQQTYTLRFRDDAHIAKLFTSDTEKPEVANMNKLLQTNLL